jgi:hypothetical protein
MSIQGSIDSSSSSDLASVGFGRDQHYLEVDRGGFSKAR